MNVVYHQKPLLYLWADEIGRLISACSRLTFSQIYRYKEGLWRRATPKGLNLKRFVEGPDGTLIHDSSFVGENAWKDDAEKAQENIKEIIEQDTQLNTDDKKVLQKGLGLSGLSLNYGLITLARYPSF